VSDWIITQLQRLLNLRFHSAAKTPIESIRETVDTIMLQIDDATWNQLTTYDRPRFQFCQLIMFYRNINQWHEAGLCGKRVQTNFIDTIAKQFQSLETMQSIEQPILQQHMYIAVGF